MRVSLHEKHDGYGTRQASQKPIVGVIHAESKKGEESIRRLLAAGKLAPQTRENYILRVRAYLRLVGMSPDQFVRNVGKDPRTFEEDFVKFIAEVSKSSASSTTAFWRDSLRRFLEINRVKGIDWDYVNQFLPKVKKSGRDRAPTVEEVRKVVTVADLRMKCLVLFLTSSGARIGSVEYLRWRDIEEVKFEGRKLAKVTIYRGEPEEYDTFVSPECYEYLLKYREIREKVGEVIAPSSPVFAREANKRRFDQSKVGPVGVGTLKNQMGELLNQMKMRGRLADTKNYRSYEWKQAHGLRKFFKTRMEVAGVKPLVIEMLMGHSTGVSGSYFKPTESELLVEYSKGVESLTVLGTEPAVSWRTVLATIRSEMMNAAYPKNEFVQSGDLSKLSTEQFAESLNRTAMGSENLEREVVQLSGVKEAARRHLPSVSTARAVMLAERDALPMNEAVAKFEVFDRILVQELGR